MLRSDRLRNLRLDKNYTHQQVADLLNIAVRMIARYEAGEVEPSGDVITRMADVFSVSTDYLLGRTDDPTPCYQAGELTDKERAVLAALRRGEPLEAIRLIVSTTLW
jgi:transcriptional regulator with XRE-family HTH domain